MFTIHCLERALYYKPAHRNLILALHCVSQLRANNSLPEPCVPHASEDAFDISVSQMQ